MHIFGKEEASAISLKRRIDQHNHLHFYKGPQQKRQAKIMRGLSLSETGRDIHGRYKRPRTNGISRSFFPALFLLVLHLSFTKARDAKTITVNAIVPQSLRKDNMTGFANVISAEFGKFHLAPASNPADDPHGSLIVNLYQIGSSLCTAEQVDAARKKKETEKWKPPFGLLIDRNSETSGKTMGCTYVQQARHAQELGAAAGVLINYKCLCDDDAICNSHTTCESIPPVVHDDRTGKDVRIPVVMLTKQDGQAIKEALKSSGGVTIEMNWKPFRSEIVTVTLWHTPFFYSSSTLGGAVDEEGEDPRAGAWWQNMSIVMYAFNELVEFSPRYMFLDGADIGCLQNPICNSTCTNGGRYCDLSPGGDNGVALYHIEESLVRRCIWRHVQQSNDPAVKEHWWMYVSYTSEHCPRVSDGECRRSILEHDSIFDMVQDCITDSGGIHEDVHNALLAEELEIQKRHGPHLNPTLTVNQIDIHHIQGNHHHPYLNAASVFEAVCNALLPEHKHAACSICLACQDPIFCLAQSQPWSCDAHPSPQPKKRRYYFRNFLIWCIFIGGMVFAAKQYRRFRNEQNLEAFFQNNSDYTLSENLFGNE